MSVDNRPEIVPFISNWFGKPRNQTVEEIASYALESNGAVDTYYYTADADGDLFQPQAQEKVEKCIRRDTFLGYLEGQAFDAINRWFKQSQEGTVLWLSPPDPVEYPVAKIIIGELETEGGNKRLCHRSILLDFDSKRCLELARDLSVFSKNYPKFENPDQVRAAPFILNTQKGGWIYILEELIEDPALWKGIKEGKDKKAKEQTLIKAQVVYQNLFGPSVRPVEGQRMLLEMLGDRIISCPSVFRKTAFQIFSDSAQIIGASSTLENYGDYHLGSCVICRRGNVLVGGCNICTSCEQIAKV